MTLQSSAASPTPAADSSDNTSQASGPGAVQDLAV